ncbi:hypothetical protein [Amnibacterium kyonggiense]|uniref:hypothetical protein n=1 Tax=Amnibacterium kyonggiense TaxID=595671 RepID=UPI00105D5A81|nr:hypothetical protein [Amnibacterium kyonggiense]
MKTQPREPLAWVLLPLALLAYAGAVIFAVVFVTGVAVTVSAATSTAPIPVPLYASAPLHPTAGTHAYSGGPYIADGTTVTATEFTAGVSGLDLATRIALTIGGTVWSATVAVVAAMVGAALLRLRRRNPDRRASRVLLSAAVTLTIGRVVAQVITAWSDIRLGHVAWIGQDGIRDFTGISPDMIDLTPFGIAALMLAIVVVMRRSEQVDP